MSDWAEVYDESSNKYYYYNATTGETSWDQPADYAAPVEAAAASSGNGDWVAVFDESSNKYYYHNPVTGEVQWDPPAGFSHEAADAGAATSVEDTASTAVAVSGLPAGWAEIYDESSQSTYYYNAETGETAWDMPVAIDLGLDQSYADNTTASSSYVQWIEHYDEGSGKTYYEHPETHETSWESPYETTNATGYEGACK